MQTWDEKRCRGGAVSRHFRLAHRVHDAPGSLEVVPMTTDEQGIVAHLEALDIHMDLTISLSRNCPALEVSSVCGRLLSAVMSMPFAAWRRCAFQPNL